MVCRGKRFGFSPCNEKNADVFISEMAQNSSLRLPRRCLRLVHTPGDVPAARQALPGSAVPVAAGPQGGAPVAHFQAGRLGCSVQGISKRGNGCQASCSDRTKPQQNIISAGK